MLANNKEDQNTKRVSITVKKKRFLSDLQSPNDKDIFENTTQYYQQIGLKIPTASDYKIKIFRDKTHWHQQIFTYVILVLCFEVKQSAKYCSSLIDSLYQLIEKQQFQFLTPQSGTELTEHSQLNLKNILSQYLNLMNEKKMPVLKSLSKYPFVLEIFVLFFRTLIYFGDQCSSYEQELEMNKIYDFLASYFQIQILLTQSFVYFSDANIYVVKLGQEEIFMLVPSSFQHSMFFNEKQLMQSHKSGISSVQMLMQSQTDSKIHSQKKQKKVKISFEKTIKRISFGESRHLEVNEMISVLDLQKKQKNMEFSVKLLNYAQSQNIIITEPLSINQIQNEIRSNQRMLGQMSSIIGNASNNCNSKHYRNRSELSPLTSSGNETILQFTDNRKKKVNKQRDLINSLNLQKDKQNNTKRKSCLKEHCRKKYESHKFETEFMKKLQQMSKLAQQTDHNLSTQFTNSFILETMEDPYKSNIKATKQRIRLKKKTKDTLPSPH